MNALVPRLRASWLALASCVVLSALLHGGNAAAQSAPPALPPTLLQNDRTLTQWIEAHNPSIKASQARIQRADAEVAVAGTWQNPEVDLGISQLSVGKPTPSTQLNYWQTPAIRLGVSQMVELGKRSHRVAAAGYRKGAATEDYHAVVNTTVAQARDILAQIVLLRAREELLAQRLTSAQEISHFAELRLGRGDISVTDRDRLLLEQASVQREKSDNDAQLAWAIATCGSLLAAPCDGATFELQDMDAAAAIDPKLLNHKVDSNAVPELRLLSDLQSAAKEDAVYWRNHAIPDPTFSVGYTRDFYVWAGDQPHTVGVNVSLPIPLFDSGQHQARTAEAEAHALADEAAARKLSIDGGVQGLLAKYTELSKKLDLISNQLLPRSESVVGASETAYRQGQTSMTDLLLVRRDHLALKLDELDTRYALFSVRNQLRLTLGLDSNS